MPCRVLQGVVVSDASHKTIVVRVVKNVKHPVYKKYITRSCKYAAHDPENLHKTGDVVKIIECRPISKTKKWHVMSENQTEHPYKSEVVTKKAGGSNTGGAPKATASAKKAPAPKSEAVTKPKNEKVTKP